MRFGPCDGVSTVGGGVRKAGFKVSGWVELSFSGFCKIVACVDLGVTLKGLMGVDNIMLARASKSIFFELRGSLVERKTV